MYREKLWLIHIFHMLYILCQSLFYHWEYSEPDIGYILKLIILNNGRWTLKKTQVTDYYNCKISSKKKSDFMDTYKSGIELVWRRINV